MDTGTVVGMVIAAISALASGFFAWMSARDKLRFDMEKAGLIAKLESLTRSHAECTTRSEEMEAELKELRAQVSTLQHEMLGKRDKVIQ